MAKQQTTTTAPRSERGSERASGRGGTPQPDRPRALLRTIRGVVASDKGHKTIKVVVENQKKHEKYGKYLKRRTELHAHDETNYAKLCESVVFSESRCISRPTHRRLLRCVRRASARAGQ